MNRLWFLTLGMLLLTAILAWQGSDPGMPAAARVLGWPVHTSSSSLRFMDALAASLSEGQSKTGASSGCAELDAVIQHSNQQFRDDLGLNLDPVKLHPMLIKTLPKLTCAEVAERLAQVNVVERLALQQGWRHASYSPTRWTAIVQREAVARGLNCTAETMLDQTSACGLLYASPLLVNAESFQTRTGFFARPGCVLPMTRQECLPPDLGLAADRDSKPVAALIHKLAARRLLDVRSQDALPPNQRHGENLRLTLQSGLQQRAEVLSRCFTRQAPRPDECTGLALPDELPTGAASVVVAEVATGRIVALAQSFSDCSRWALSQKAPPGVIFHDPEIPCTALPDERRAGIMQAPLSQLEVGPASLNKVPVNAAALMSGLAYDHDEMRAILASSVDSDALKRLAFQVGPVALREAMDALGMTGASNPQLLPEPQLGPLSNPAAISSLLDFDHYLNIRAARKSNGAAAAIRQFGPDAAYLASHSYALLATGGGDMRFSQMRLLAMFQTIAARANNMSAIPELHLFESDRKPLTLRDSSLSADAARSLLDLTSWVTRYYDRGVNGTAGRACFTVFGHCPVSGLYGKSGTPDFAIAPCKLVADAVYPVKHFTAAFSIDGTERPSHVVSVMVFRTRALLDKSNCLEGSNRAAEIALRLVQTMRLEAEANQKSGMTRSPN